MRRSCLYKQNWSKTIFWRKFSFRSKNNRWEKENNFDLVELNLSEANKQKREVSIRKIDEPKKEIKNLSKKEIIQIKSEIKNKQKLKKLSKKIKNRDANKSLKK